ncbi:heterokaryon incompatibility protein-domain-containing protein [Cladorrhinum sp. PSN332]|nr:heterokaryon incompatibility protein-domain-containing protein [Cladorrhinum sp. PSN332]
MPSSKDQVPISLPQGMILNPGVLIYDRIKEWLNTCRTDPQHERVCSLKISYRPPNLRLIDVERIVVIPAPPEAEYVALSYVWGANQSEGFPQVVLDSIEVVRALGYRYLWVDKYCIDQNDATNKHEQIRNMHLIYGCADLTIIAAAGTDSAYGLPGVSRHRLPHDTLHFGNITLFLPLLNASRLIKQSYWNSRAWTYQEALLSRRRLVFTDHHVLWQCNNEVFAEGIHWASRHRTHKHHHPFDLSASNAVMSTREGYSLQFSVGSVFDQIEGYSTKRLSYESDRLNAYLGILGDQETRDKPIYHVWGALVIRQGLAWKLKGLDWYRKSPTTRSPIFPSWSWAAWSADGGIHFAGKLGDNGSSTPLDVRTTVWPPDIPAWLPRDKTGRDLDDLISIQTFADRHDEYRSYSTGAHMIRLEVELGEVSLHSVNGKRYVRIQEPDEELLVPFYLDDADFSLEQRQPAHAFKVTHISQWGNDTWVFLVIKMVTDESYQRIGSFRLRLGKIRDEEAIDNFGNSIREENYCNVSEDWRKGLKKTHIWLS